MTILSGMAKRRQMTAKQLKYFGKRKSKVVRVKKTRRVKTMVKHRYVAKARGFASGLGGKGMLAPIIGGVADNVLDRYLPIPIDGIGAVAAGIFLKSPVTRDIGLYKVGFSIGNMIPLPGSTSSGGYI